MVDEQDEDALFERLAKSLEAVRRDAEMARGGGTEGIAAGLARVETELRNLTSNLDGLRRRSEQQHAVNARLDAAAAKTQTELAGLHQTIEALSQRVREQAELLAKAPGRKISPRAAALAGVVVACLLGAGGAAAWVASGREPTLSALAHRFVVRVSELTGINLAGPDKATSTSGTVAQATPAPETTPQAPPPATPAEPAQAPQPLAAAQPTPVEAPAPAATPTPAAPPAAASPPTEAAAATSAPAPQLQAQTAAPASTQSTPAATAIEQTSHPPQVMHRLVLRVTADSWVAVRDKGGHMLLRRVMRQGETWRVPAEPDLVMDSGNAGALELEVDGGPPARVNVKGVVRDVPLDASLIGAGAARPAQ
jgi:cytoskeletal protein RodZ